MELVQHVLYSGFHNIIYTSLRPHRGLQQHQFRFTASDMTAMQHHDYQLPLSEEQQYRVSGR